LKIPPPLDIEPSTESLAKAGPLWLFLDYDGTLADFAPTPDHVLPDPELIELLERLARLPQVRITVISGRRLSHIQKLLPIDGIILAGSYGLELHTMDGPSHPLDYGEIRPVIEEVKPAWEILLAGRQGFYLEDKGWTLAIHARFAVESEAEQVLQAALDEVRAKPALESFRILGGHRFLEIGPRLANKGQTVEYLLDRFPFEGASLLFIGDDDKDEEAFQVIQAHSGTALVTSDPPRLSQADFRLQNPSQVRRFLSRLADKLEKSKVERDA
jgi:trehalose 6-phosphate phosphatase